MKKCYCSNKKIEPVCTEVNGITVVVIPAQLGGSGEGELYAPQTCRYKNTVVKYLADGYVYIYDKVGNWTLIADSNAIEPTIDTVLDPNSENPIANFAVTRAINELTASLVSLDESLASVAKSGDYNDLTNKPVIDTALDTTSNNAVTNAAIATAIEEITTEIDRPVLYDLEMTADANSVTFTEDKIDVVTGETTQEVDVIPTASETTAGTISASEYSSIKSSQERLDALEGGSVAVTGLPASPTQAQLTAAWLAETSETELINRASIYDIDNTKVWTYYDNTQTWYEVTAGTISVNPFTNSTPGTILGSTTAGNVSANLDGTGTVSGWSTLVSDVSGKADASSLATVATTGDYSDLLNKPVVDSSLSTSSTNAVENQAIATEFEDVAYIGTNMGTISDTAFVGSANIQTGAVTTVKIADLNVTTDKIASNAITTPKIADGAVTSDKIDWTTIWSNNSITKTVTDSNNRTGIYFGDGTLITYRKASANIDITSSWGSLYYGTTTGSYSFAPSSESDFIAEPIVQVTAYASSTRGFWMGNYTTNAPSVIASRWAVNNISVFRPTTQTGVNCTFEIIAIGRWK